jgi:Predicted Zn peptidase
MTDQIALTAQTLTKRCNSRDPFVVARTLGVRVLLVDDFVNLKGMYRVIKRSRFIFINAALDKSMRRIVCAHELGHDALHREAARKDTVQDTMLFGVDSRQEYEANLFAAHLLIDSDEVLGLAKRGYTSQYIAATLCTDVNLISIIADYLIAQGEQLRPQTRKNNILK